MTNDMPRPRPLNLHRTTSRHGKVVWYVQKGRGAKKIRLRAEYGSPAFWTQYEAAMLGKAVSDRLKPGEGTLAWLVGLYRNAPEWTRLSLATRRQRENILKKILASAGHEKWRVIDRKNIKDGVARRKDTPSQARHFLDTMTGLFRWAVEAEIVAVDPTRDIALPEAPKTEGFPVWSDDDIQRFEKRWPLGTRERLALDLLLYTGFRRGDAVRVGRQHVRQGEIVIKTEKTGTEVTIPILPELQASIDAAPTGDLSYICGERGLPLTKESFGNWFRDACRAAGVKKSAHGLRKAGATRAANNGATVAQLEAIFGWKGGGMASLYTRAADRARLSRGSISMLSKNGDRTTTSPTLGKGEKPKAKTKAKSNA
jgi:integrase